MALWVLVDHVEDDLCFSLCQGLPWRPRHLHVPQWCCYHVVAPRAIMQSSQLINLSVLSVGWLQDRSWYKAASVPLQPSPTQMRAQLRSWADFISKTQLLLLWISLIHVGVFSLRLVGKLGEQCMCPQHPASCPFSSGSLGTGGGLQSSDFPPCWMALCLDKRGGEEWCWLEMGLCCHRSSPFPLPKVQMSRVW